MATRATALCALALMAGTPAAAQQVHQLNCMGKYRGYDTQIQGTREYRQTSASGGYVRCQGTIASSVGRGQIGWEGYTATAPFSGMVVSRVLTEKIGVLDNTVGMLVIYDDRPTLGPPTELGSFRCQWR